MNLYHLIEEEERGTIFCKIGKSSDEMWGKGGHFPYRDYIGKLISLSEGSITFERLDDVVKYLHYGDDLVIFSFSEGRNQLPMDEYFDNGMNEGCYNTKYIYVKEVLSFEDADTVDYIYRNLKNKTNFINYVHCATKHLEDRNLFDAAKRWQELVDNEKSFNNEEGKERPKVFWDYIVRWLKNSHRKE